MWKLGAGGWVVTEHTASAKFYLSSSELVKAGISYEYLFESIKSVGSPPGFLDGMYVF